MPLKCIGHIVHAKVQSHAFLAHLWVEKINETCKSYSNQQTMECGKKNGPLYLTCQRFEAILSPSWYTLLTVIWTISRTISISVLSMCEFGGKSALLIVNNSDSLDTDSTSLSGFSPVFEVAAIRQRKAFLPRPDAKERLEQLCESRYGNLYMW